jgi:acyl carrier protein
MSSEADVKAHIVASLEPVLRLHGFDVAALADDVDLRAAGLVDSLGFLGLIGDLERRLSVSIDLSELDPNQLTRLGPLSRYLAARTVSS